MEYLNKDILGQIIRFVAILDNVVCLAEYPILIPRYEQFKSSGLIGQLRLAAPHQLVIRLVLERNIHFSHRYLIFGRPTRNRKVTFKSKGIIRAS